MLLPASLSLHAQRQRLAGLAGFTGDAIRILIADDIEAWHCIYTEVLRARPNWQIIGTARDVAQAVQQSRDLNPDVILLDVDLDRMDSLEVASQISQESPASRILFVGFDDPSQVPESVFSAGAYGYVMKRNVVLDLVPALETVADGGRFVSGRIS